MKKKIVFCFFVLFAASAIFGQNVGNKAYEGI